MAADFFYKKKLPQITNPRLVMAIEQIKKESNKEDAIKSAIKIIAQRFKGYRFKTYLYFWKIFESDPNKLWDRPGNFMHCHHQNLLLRTLLVKSGLFEDEDIRLGYSFVWFISPHQYLHIKLDDRKVTVDPWNHHFGAKWDQHASGFGFDE